MGRRQRLILRSVKVEGRTFLSESEEERVDFPFRERGGDGRHSVRRGRKGAARRGSKFFPASGKARAIFRLASGEARVEQRRG